MVPAQEQYAIIPHLIIDRVYEFRVVGVNVAGHGEPSDASPSVCIRPTRGLFLCHAHYAYLDEDNADININKLIRK